MLVRVATLLDFGKRIRPGGAAQRMSAGFDGRPPRGERGGPVGGVAQRMSAGFDGRPPRGERGGHFEAPA